MKKADLTNFDEGEFTVVFEAKSKILPSKIKGSAAGYDVDRVVATLRGTASKDKDALVLAAADSKFLLKNREKKEGQKWEDLVAKIEGWLKDKKDSVKVAGEITEDGKGNLTLTLESAESAESKK